eukprot:TRINITY_DN4091_c0_g1_i5.p1 TRINITY_DN4091_c0_g1~~TRINITY_DN4091_c0_g1_i5.p1  ORF type:complete len:1155 (+),score=243.54 TRINITY_DN4091_c0_g1_i5:460-3465(+)
MGGTKTPRDTPHRGTPTAPSSTGHHHAPFSHTVQRLQSVPLCCVPRAVACCDATVFLINPFAPPSSRARTGAADAKLLSQGPALPANRAVTVDCLPTLRASDRFTTRTPSACSSSAGSAKHLRYSSLGVNDFAGHKGGDGPSGTMCALATAAELVQELYREHQRGAVYDDTASLALLYEGYLLLAARTCHLRLAAALLPEGPASASVEAFSVQLDLQNTLLLQECVATVLGDMYFKLERGSDGPSHSHRGGRTRYHHSSRDFENASVRSGTSIDGQSEKDSYWSVYSSSYGEVGGMNVTDTAELYGGSNMPDPSAMGIMATSSGTSFVMDEAAGAGVLSGLGGGKGLWSWVFYASSDRSLRMAYTMLRRDHWALLSYLDCVLFSQSKPKVLATSAEAMPPLLSEEQGNALLALYSRYAPHKLCSVVWDSWLGRAKGGVACFTAGVAARLLLEACGKVSSASRRYSSSSRLTTTSAHTRSYDGSEVEERDTQENYGVNLWGCTPPREQFVIGLLLLEDGRVGGTVESWAAIDGTALTELASSSSHLWEPDVYPGDSTEELLCAILPDMEGASGGISEDALASSLHVVGAALEEPSSGASRTLTMGTLLALHFPWLLVPSLIAAREKFSIPITSCLRLLKCVPPSCQRQGLLVTRFLQSVLPPANKLTRIDHAVRAYSLCHLLHEMLTYSEQCISSVTAPNVEEEIDEYDEDEDEQADGFLGVMQGLTFPNACEGTPKGGADKSLGLFADSHADRASDADKETALEALKPPTPLRFIDMVDDVQQLKEAPGPHMDPSLLPGWVSSLTLEPFSGTMVDSFMASLVLTGDEQGVAAFHFSLRSLQCVLWKAAVPDAMVDCIVATAHRLVRGDQQCDSKLYGDGVISLAVLALVKRAEIDQSLVLLEGIFPPAVILSFAVEHCGSDPNLWRGLVTRLLSKEAPTDNRYFLTKVLEVLADTLPLAAFVSLLPPEGNTRFFLPFITRAVDIHKAELLKQRSLSLIDHP